jgi:hypothetical protein
MKQIAYFKAYGKVASFINHDLREKVNPEQKTVFIFILEIHPHSCLDLKIDFHACLKSIFFKAMNQYQVPKRNGNYT